MRVVEDRRVAGVVEYYLLGEEESLPTVPASVRNCVGFVYDDDRGKTPPSGTVFFVNIYDYSLRNAPWTYAITSRHVITDAKRDGLQRQYIRLNRHGGRPFLVNVKLSDWTLHPTTEVAIMHFPLPRLTDCDPFWLVFGRDDSRAFPEDGNPGPAMRLTLPFGEGDDVYFAGVFEQRPGEKRNIPVIRAGTISAFPGEPIDTKRHGSFPAYLIEARSNPAMSGSPVFWCSPPAPLPDPPLMTPLYPSGRMVPVAVPPRLHLNKDYQFNLLGVAYGHYKTKYRNRPMSRRVHDLNTGIALVVPAGAIRDLIEGPKEIEVRKKANERNVKRASDDIVADRRSSQPERAMPSQQDFERVLRRASRPTRGASQPGRGTTKT